jgi:hypothetical protein
MFIFVLDFSYEFYMIFINCFGGFRLKKKKKAHLRVLPYANKTVLMLAGRIYIQSEGGS